MVFVYFESDSHAELRATFIREEDYMLALPILEMTAKNEGMMVTESIEVNYEIKIKHEDRD